MYLRRLRAKASSKRHFRFHSSIMGSWRDHSEKKHKCENEREFSNAKRIIHINHRWLKHRMRKENISVCFAIGWSTKGEEELHSSPRVRGIPPAQASKEGAGQRVKGLHMQEKINKQG